MPDINLIPIRPAQLSGAGESGLYDVNRFDRKYLAQGDSWFSIGHVPFWSTTNLLQQTVLSRSALAVSCASPGVWLSHMTDTSTAQVFLNLLNGNIAWKWDALLISGGGNDLIAAASVNKSEDASLRLFLGSNEWGAQADATRYLSEAGWNTFTAHMSDVLDILLTQRDKSINAGIPLLLHTYDYVTPRNAPAGPGMGPWLYKAMNDMYAVPAADWNALADALINRLAEMWLALAAKNAGRNIRIVDSRGSTTRADAGTTSVSGDWENEIHPTPHGYTLLAQRWRTVIDALP
jgi:hypothetical protein